MPPLVLHEIKGRVSSRSVITVNPTFCSWYLLCILFRLFHTEYRGKKKKKVWSYRRDENCKKIKNYRKPADYDDWPSLTQLLKLPTFEGKICHLFYHPAGSSVRKDCSFHKVLLSMVIERSGESEGHHTPLS